MLFILIQKKGANIMHKIDWKTVGVIILVMAAVSVN